MGNVVSVMALGDSGMRTLLGQCEQCELGEPAMESQSGDLREDISFL